MGAAGLEPSRENCRRREIEGAIQSGSLLQGMMEFPSGRVNFAWKNLEEGGS